jgi:hypothetical protein
MKTIRVIAVASSLLLLAACGSSGGSGPAPTPTTPEAQAASGASVEMAQQAAGKGAQNGLQQFGPSAMILKAASAGATKTSQNKQINLTENCDGSGSYTVTGTMVADCTITATTGECIISSTSMNIEFADCAKSITIAGTPYQTTITGPATATMSGNVSVDLTVDPVVFTAVSFAGTIGGTVAVGGDVVGTVDLSGVTFDGEGAPEPTITCGGSCTVTMTGAAAATCGVTTTCDGCTE